MKHPALLLVSINHRLNVFGPHLRQTTVFYLKVQLQCSYGDSGECFYVCLEYNAVTVSWLRGLYSKSTFWRNVTKGSKPCENCNSSQCICQVHLGMQFCWDFDILWHNSAWSDSRARTSWNALVRKQPKWSCFMICFVLVLLYSCIIWAIQLFSVKKNHS